MTSYLPFNAFGIVNVSLLLALYCVISSGPLHGQEQGVPRIMPLVYGTEDLVPVVSYDVSQPPYNADRYGKQDSTQAFVQALEDAKETGGTVYAPAGRYRITGNLVIPSGVTLRGDWKRPSEMNVMALGTVLMAYAGRGSEEGKPFLSVLEGSLRDLSVFYPEQNPRSVVPYPVCVDLGGNSAVKNLILVNPYIGIVTGSFSTVLNLYGTPLKTGVIMLKAAAVPRCSGIRFSPRYWAESNLPGSPSFQQAAALLAEQKAFGIQLNRQDAGIFIDVDIDYYPTAVKVMPPHGWTYWHDLQVTNAKVGMHFTGGSHHRVNITGSTLSTSQYGVLMQMDKEGWKENWNRHSKSGKPFGTNRDFSELRMFECTFEGTGTNVFLDGSYAQRVDIQECTFASWGTGKDDYAIDVKTGVADVYDSVFEGNSSHVRIAGRRSSLVMIGNRFSGTPDIEHSRVDKVRIDHKNRFSHRLPLKPLGRVPNSFPARIGPESLYLVTDAPFNAPSDGEGDATAAIQQALNQAGEEGGGTVYLPQGRYRLTEHLTVPAGVELRGINDSMPRAGQTRTMLIADVPQDMGEPDNPALINLQSSPELGGSGISGLAIWYPHQDFRDIQPYPWTIRSWGPGCWARRLYLGNCYNAVDFATHPSDKHVLSRVNGSALNIGFMVGNTDTIGWIDNCHLRPQDWSTASSKGLRLKFPGDNIPTKNDIFRGTEHSLIPNMRGSGAITIGSGAKAQITGFFTNGSTRAFDFVDHNGTGGGTANILIGGSEAGWGAWVKDLAPMGVTFTNFSFNPMTRLPYVTQADVPDGQLPKGMVMRIDPTVPTSTPINMVISKYYARDKIEMGFDVRGGSLIFKQMEQEHGYDNNAVEINGGHFFERNIRIGAVEEEG